MKKLITSGFFLLEVIPIKSEGVGHKKAPVSESPGLIFRGFFKSSYSTILFTMMGMVMILIWVGS